LRHREPNLPGDLAYALFDTVLEDGGYWGEDYVFCRRWGAIGGETFVDPSIAFRHVGMKAFAGRLGDHLESAS
jgi:hypothetical protein